MNSSPAVPRPRSLDRDEWLSLAPRFSDHGYTQGWEYGQGLARLSGARCEFLALEDQEGLVGLASVRVKPLAVLGTGLAYVSGGPLVRTGDADAGARLERCAVILRAEYVERRGMVLRLRPPVGPPGYEDQVDARLEQVGFERAVDQRRYRTLLLELAPDEDVLRAAFSKRWRRHLKQSERAELRVTRSSDPAAFDVFCELHREMVGRKSFHTDLDAEFYAELQRVGPEQEAMDVWLARSGDETVAGLVASVLGDTAVYVLGASGPIGRDLRASYRLHWELLCDARRRGMRWYDLGGIDPEANPGVTTFKQGIGTHEVWGPGPFDAVPDTFRGRLVPLGERLVRTFGAWRRRRIGAGS